MSKPEEEKSGQSEAEVVIPAKLIGWICPNCHRIWTDYISNCPCVKSKEGMENKENDLVRLEE